MTERTEITITDHMKLKGKLESAGQTILPAKLQVRYLQRLEIPSLEILKIYQANLKLDMKFREEHFLWIENLKFCNRKSLILLPPNFYTTTDALAKGFRPTC